MYVAVATNAQPGPTQIIHSSVNCVIDGLRVRVAFRHIVTCADARNIATVPCGFADACHLASSLA
jgi:hypothetical protein